MVERRDAPGLFSPPGYAHVASATGRMVFTAGAVPLDSEGNLVGEGDYDAQTEQVTANLEAQLAAGGATAADVVKTTVYVVAGDVPLARVWDVFSRSPLAEAPSTLLGVASLGYTGQLVEIEAVAVVP
jgi:enamine deaminase RidA (YjgF/YER057c/UK114 family)